MTHLLVTNDFPPKVGGIQVYLWELWRRLDPSSYAVLTASSDPGASEFDAEQASLGVRIDRIPQKVMLPTPALVRRIREAAAAVDAKLVVLDPALPVGLLGPSLGLPYAVVLHGAEVTVPGRLPGARQMLARVLGGADLAICAGTYPAAEGRRAAGRRMPPVVEVPPGVDVERFHPLIPKERTDARRRLGLPLDGPLVVSVSRLVPRKGMDVLVEAAGALMPSFPDLTVAIGGTGRDMGRIKSQIAGSGADVRLLGRVPDDMLPSLYASADVFVMACRDRWMGLEQEGFGIVFLEAASCEVPQIAGRSGGAYEAVVDGRTGIVVSDPKDPGQVAAALRRLLLNPQLRQAMGQAGRQRAQESFAYDLLARKLADALHDVGG